MATVEAKKKVIQASGGKMSQKQQAKQQMKSTQLGQHTEKLAKSKKSASSNNNTYADLSKDKKLQEANEEIQKLNELGLGEDISDDEFYKHFMKLPSDPTVNTYIKMDDDQMSVLYSRHARYRFEYLKKECKDKITAEVTMYGDMGDISEDFLDKMGYFEHFERDGTLDWSFHSDLCNVKDLNDYQRLVPRNYGGCEYVDWNQYRRTFHSYETEEEYLKYCEEISKNLKWIEDYVLIVVPSIKWGKISSRGAYQAIKIASGFRKITPSLAYTGFYECVGNFRFDALWLKDLDGVYFEVWLRVTKQKKSFRDALEEVYKLKKFPLRQGRMKYALEHDSSDMEMEFHTCTAGVPSEVTDEKAYELIAEAAKKLVERPKFYEHYIRKKMAIAHAIGLVPMVQRPSVESEQVDV